MTDAERFFKIKSILQEKDKGFSLRGFNFSEGMKNIWQKFTI